MRGGAKAAQATLPLFCPSSHLFATFAAVPRGPRILYQGDNLAVLRAQLPDASVDLVYLDPPFNSQRDYRVLGRVDEEPVFTDACPWDAAAEQAFAEMARPSRSGRARGTRTTRHTRRWSSTTDSPVRCSSFVHGQR